MTIPADGSIGFTADKDTTLSPDAGAMRVEEHIAAQEIIAPSRPSAWERFCDFVDSLGLD